jgi:hypothetical protein
VKTSAHHHHRNTTVDSEEVEIMWKTFGITLLLLMSGGTCFAQTAYKGLTPGKSTRVEIERLLGQPVNKVSETLLEYRSQPLTGKIYVQYRRNSPVVERIEFLCRTENSTCNDLIRSLSLRLPDDKAAAGAANEKKWRILYESPFFVVTSGDTADELTDGNLTPARLAFYSRELYEAEFSRVKVANEKAAEDLKKPPPPEPGQITGIVKLNGNPVAGATIDLYRMDLSGRLQAKADRHGVFIFFGVFSGSYVAVASGPGMKWAYVNGLRIPVPAALEIVAEPGDGARPTQEQVMAAIR